jgi:hypothetical protein
MAGFRPVSAGIWSAGIRRRWLDVAGFRRRQYFFDRMLLDSDAAGFLRPNIAGFRQLDIKHEWKELEFNFRKRFTIFKTVNRFLKIKEAFTVKPKMIFVDNYFLPYQTS